MSFEVLRRPAGPAPVARVRPAPGFEVVQGAGAALLKPPTFEHTLAYLEHADPAGRYLVPFGWYRTRRGVPGLVWCSLVEDAYHITYSGQSGAGKEGEMRQGALALAYRHGPEEVQFGIIDGSRGVNWGCWEDRAHCWRFVAYQEGEEGQKEIKGFTEAIELELAQRAVLLREHNLDSWEELPDEVRPPLLVLLITELAILEFELGPRFDKWLTMRMNEGRKFGLRFWLQTQTFSGEGKYRKQVSIFVAGFQTIYHDDRPNTGLSTADLELIGAIPPSKLPPVGVAPGVFTVVHGREAETIRGSHLSSAAMRELVAGLPASGAVADRLLKQALEQIPPASEAPAAPSRPAPEDDPELAALGEALGQVQLDDKGKPVQWTREHAKLAAFLGLAALQGKKLEDYKLAALIALLFPEAAAKGQRGSYGVKVRKIAGHVAPVLEEVVQSVQKAGSAEKPADPAPEEAPV